MPDADLTMLLVAGGLLVLVLLLAALGLFRWSRRRSLRRRYGPEYERVVESAGSRRAAEHELTERERRVQQYRLRKLEPEERRDLGARWRAVQVDFVDHPAKAVEGADRLIVEVMRQRGYPEGGFDQRLADASVSYPEMAADYREARQVAERSREGMATTEQMRHAMVLYRNLFAALLGVEEVPVAGLPARGQRPHVRH
jgi:hypothetical protein